MDLGPGQRVGNLEIERELGHGAFGVVYLARDLQIGRPVALKVLRPPDHQAESHEQARALTEIRALGQINSPHVVTLYGVDGPTADGSWLFAMEYVEGGTLADALAGAAPWPPDRAVAFALDLARGLEAAHRAGIVHGDLKPSNVLLGPAGAPKLTDFGLARIVGDLSLSLSEDTGLAGTPLWMAPEVVRGDRPTAAADIWSLGVVLYQLLTGAHPFPAPHLNALFFSIQYRDPPPLPDSVPASLRELVLRCMDKRPERRPASCTAILRELAHPPRAAGAAPRPAATTGPSLVGRDRELARLAHAIGETASGKGRAVLLTGATGIGKSALAAWAHDAAEAAGFAAVSASVSPLRGVLRPLLEGVRTLLDRTGAAPDDSASFESARDVAERLLTEEETVRLESREQTLWAVEQLLGGVSSTRHLFVHLEDVHRADPEDHRIVRHLARTLPDRGILLLMTSRLEGPAATPAHELAALPGVDVLPLGPLDREHVYQLLQERTRVAHVAPEVAHEVYRAAQGNPLFTTELLRHLEETGAVARNEAGLVPGPHWQRRGIPDRLRDLVARRLGGIDDADRELLDAAAVDGARFDGEALAAVMGKPLLAILRHLQRIYRQYGLVAPSEEGYRFANSLFQEVLYADLAPELRRAIHLQLANHLESRAAKEAVDPERIGLHWERAGEPDRARGHLLRAAHRASVHQEYLRAIDCARRAGVDPDHLDVGRFLPEHSETLIRLAFCYQATGHSAEAEKLLQSVIDAAPDETLRLRAYVRLANIRYRAHGPGALDIEELERAAETLPPCLELGRAQYLLGLVTKYALDLDAAERWFGRADEVFRYLRLLAQHAHALDQLGSVRLRRAQWAEAERLYAEAVSVARACGQDLNATISDVNRANAAFHAGRDVGVDEVLEAAVRKLHLHGASNHAGHAATLLASVRYARGDRAAAERTENEALQLLSEGSYWVGKASAHVGRAHFVALRGDLDGARHDLESAHRFASEGGSHVVSAMVATLACHIDLWARNPVGAEEAANESLRLGGVEPESNDQTERIVWLVEAVLYGLPVTILRRIRSLVESASAATLPTADWLMRIVAGAEAWLDPDGPTAPLFDAARALAEPPRGDRRALLLALAPLFESEATRRAGERDAASALLRRALERAESLEHKWLGALVRRRIGV